MAAVYRVSGNRSAYSVQTVQAVFDTVLSMVLITGLAVTAYGWPTAKAASVFAALSPLLAMVGVAPSSDAPTTWFVIAGLWLLLMAAKRVSVRWAFASGIMLGVACWLRVNPLYLCFFWALPLLFFTHADRRRRILMAAAVVLGTILMISPIVIRNYVVFPDFTPTGGTIGANLWEGLGETELGRANGFAFGDDIMVERERGKMGVPAGAPFEAMWPDGIKRDRERTRESLAFIKQHPVWYAGVMLHRMWGMLKIAGEPLPYYGTSGINVTSRKCLAPARQGGVLALLVNVLGMVQSVARYALLPFAAIGCWFAARANWSLTSLLLATIVYYLVPGTVAHTEIRYVLTLHWILPIFAGLTVVTLAAFIRRRRSPHTQTVGDKL
jgi:4-amino-4-deoxy-L-arabinose transferase-like glycosyltransferase